MLMFSAVSNIANVSTCTCH